MPADDLRQRWRVQVRLLLGPAGSGKTYRCLTEIRAALKGSAEGPPLVLLAPKQATFQLERQLLADPEIAGYARLRILSFERLAHLILEKVHQRTPGMLDEEGRVMVLRSLLTSRGKDLKLFRASARLAGFAQQLSQVLGDLQRSQLTPDRLNELAEGVRAADGLSYKLQDLATVLQEYLDWLAAHALLDADSLLAIATEALKSQVSIPKSQVSGLKFQVSSDRSGLVALEEGLVSAGGEIRIAHLWVDGFAEFSEQELSLLATAMPFCDGATIALCLEGAGTKHSSWLSHWSVVRKTLEQCRKRLAESERVEVVTETLLRRPDQSRFLKHGVLQHLERHWADPQPYPTAGTPAAEEVKVTPTLRVVVCSEPQAEATLAAREVLRHVRGGGRYRDISVVVRKLEGYHSILQRVFTRYGIPFFLDRRESVSHHPLAELARSALRTVAFQWQPDDWFAALKTGLVQVAEADIDRLENEALARGWRGGVWQKPIAIHREPELTEWVARLQQRIMPPFHRLALAMAECQNKPTGVQLAAGLRGLWRALQVEGRLQEWAAVDVSTTGLPLQHSMHATVWEQMNTWLANVEMAFPTEPLSLRDWLPILEAGLATLTVGVIPPALDQVLIGAIDRSRNPDLKLALVLGLNENIFPAPPESGVLLTDAELIELEQQGVTGMAHSRHQLGRERFYAYIACTRARSRLVLTCAQHDNHGSPLNPSPFVAHIQRLFPTLEVTIRPSELGWQESEHVTEIIGRVLKISSLRSQVSTTVHSPRSTVHSPESKVQSPKSKIAGEGVTQFELEFVNEGVRRDVGIAVSDRADDLNVTSHARVHRGAGGEGARISSWERLASLPAIAPILEQLGHLRNPRPEESLSREAVESLYGKVLATSVSRMENFAACPFKFLVQSGLRAEERRLFELDIKEQGSFQHEVLAQFHNQLRNEGKRWRDITPKEARERVAALTQSLMASYREGLLEASEETRFMAGILSESLQDFVETLVGWMRHQYRFDPAAVELPFGHPGTFPAWSIELGGGHRLDLHGRIDRVDLCREGEDALCVVVDYKSSQKQLEPILIENGVQLQLLAYLNVLRRWSESRDPFGAAQLIPAGVFYVNLRGKYGREANRRDALEHTDEARRLAYQHTGRFDVRALRQLDTRPDAKQGDQFNYRRTKDGRVSKSAREAMTTSQFAALLDLVEESLRRMGRQIYDGVADVSPFRKGATLACDQCAYHAICRIDPWTHRYRTLGKTGDSANE